MNNKNKIQKEIVEELKVPSHGILLLAPRIGKTKIGIDILKKEKPKSVLWVTPSRKLRDVDIPNEFKQWKAKTLFKKVKIVCWSSLGKVKGHYDKIIFDEYQEITIRNSRNLFDGKLSFNSIICLSGTHPEHEEKLDILNRLKLNILKEIDIDEAIEQKLIADYDINVVYTDIDNIRKDVVGGSKKKSFMTTESKQYDYLTKMIRTFMYKGNPKFMILKRMHLIYNSITKEKVAQFLLKILKGRKLIFTGSIEQAERMSPHTYHSKTDDKDLNSFINQDIDLLACVKAGGVGFTYKKVDHFIIIQTDSDKKGETTQKFARALLDQIDYKADVWFICLNGTQDKEWIEKALVNFNQDKINKLRFETLKFNYENK